MKEILVLSDSECTSLGGDMTEWWYIKENI